MLVSLCTFPELSVNIGSTFFFLFFTSCDSADETLSVSIVEKNVNTDASGVATWADEGALNKRQENEVKRIAGQL